MKSPFALAAFAVLFFSILVWLYVREFSVLSNTLEARALIAGSMLVVGVVVGAILWRIRARFVPYENHLAELAMPVVFSLLFAPLFGSLLNRIMGKNEMQSFVFVSETAFYASGYGILKGEKISPSGWKLTIRDGKKEHRLQYKSQAYYPNTKPGESVLLPIRRGIFGVRVVEIR